jgi:hypothetical protein
VPHITEKSLHFSLNVLKPSNYLKSLTSLLKSLTSLLKSLIIPLKMYLKILEILENPSY